MQYRVEELARAAGVRVDTVRFYQTRGLLPPPQHHGRVALYSGDHLERLRRIRTLNRQGLKLDAVGRLLASEKREARAASGPRRKRGAVRSSLLRALAQSEAAPVYTRAELESSAAVPGFLISALEEVGLLAAAEAGGGYGQTDRDTLESARVLLDAGLPVTDLLGLARDHVAHVERIAERAVALFEAHLRAQRAAQGEPPAQVAENFRRLLPAVSRLVAVHFERTLVAKARARLQDPPR
jgi:DNA-binding transcriptional MerR regulator